MTETKEANRGMGHCPGSQGNSKGCWPEGEGNHRAETIAQAGAIAQDPKPIRIDQQAKAIIRQAFVATRQTYGAALWLDASPRQYPVLIIECLGLKMQYDALILGLLSPWKLLCLKAIIKGS